jgi:2-polyprenyl-3-methyl-5-hydroxy-6-metoxy-1,4-benzoquinol methylase
MSAARKTPIENQLKSTENWYTSWFDSPYYHILYKDRNYREAQVFITYPLSQSSRKANVLDLACGKGVILFT